MPERTSFNASTFSADRRDRISVTVRPTEEKSLSDWVELADMHKKTPGGEGHNRQLVRLLPPEF